MAECEIIGISGVRQRPSSYKDKRGTELLDGE